MTGSVAGTIQGEAGSNPANQFAVAATIYNRLQTGTFGATAHDIVNAPQQFVAPDRGANESAQKFAQAIDDGTLPQMGNVGNALNFQSGQTAVRNGLADGGANIGGNFFSDNLGPPSSSFVAPQFGGSTDVAPDQFNPNVVADNFGADLQLGNLPDSLGAGSNIQPDTSGITSMPESTTAPGGDLITTDLTSGGGGGGLTYFTKPESTTPAVPAKSSLNIPDVGAAITSGFNNITAGISGQIGQLIASSEAFLGRGFVMLLAIGIFLAAAWLMVPRETKTQIAGTVAKVAA